MHAVAALALRENCANMCCAYRTRTDTYVILDGVTCGSSMHTVQYLLRLFETVRGRPEKDDKSQFPRYTSSLSTRMRRSRGNTEAFLIPPGRSRNRSRNYGMSDCLPYRTVSFVPLPVNRYDPSPTIPYIEHVRNGRTVGSISDPGPVSLPACCIAISQSKAEWGRPSRYSMWMALWLCLGRWDQP